jgi:hypothetical protein
MKSLAVRRCISETYAALILPVIVVFQMLWGKIHVASGNSSSCA